VASVEYKADRTARPLAARVTADAAEQDTATLSAQLPIADEVVIASESPVRMMIAAKSGIQEDRET
jgi:hypothetical protein